MCKSSKINNSSKSNWFLFLRKNQMWRKIFHKFFWSFEVRPLNFHCFSFSTSLFQFRKFEKHSRKERTNAQRLRDSQQPPQWKTLELLLHSSHSRNRTITSKEERFEADYVVHLHPASHNVITGTRSSLQGEFSTRYRVRTRWFEPTSSCTQLQADCVSVFKISMNSCRNANNISLNMFCQDKPGK